MAENDAPKVKEAKAPIQLKVSQLIADLDNGIDRAEQAKKYGLPMSRINQIYKHPLLKGKKVKRALDEYVQLVDDVTPSTGEATEGATSEAEGATEQVNNGLGEAATQETAEVSNSGIGEKW